MTILEQGNIMKGKRGLIMGVANQRSIAWGIAEAAAAQGAELAFTYPNEAMLKRVKPLAEQAGSNIVIPCDVTDQDSIKETFKTIEKEWGKFDFLLHAIAFSDKDELNGKYYNTSLDNFLNSMNVSCYSLTSITKHAVPLMNEGGSILTLTYYGAEKVMPHYNVMGVCKAALEASVRYLAADCGEFGIRVNAISAGPIKTLAASGIGDFNYILKWNEYNSPMKRNVTIEEVGASGLYFLSDLSQAVTGEIHHVDGGYHVVGMKDPYAPDMTLQDKKEDTQQAS